MNPTLKDSIPYPQPLGIFPIRSGAKGRAIDIDLALQHIRLFLQSQINCAVGVDGSKCSEQDAAFATFCRTRILDGDDGAAVLDISNFILTPQQLQDNRVITTANNKHIVAIGFVQSNTSA